MTFAHTLKKEPRNIFRWNPLMTNWPTFCNVLRNRTAADDDSRYRAETALLLHPAKQKWDVNLKSLPSSIVYEATGVRSYRWNPNLVLSILSTKCHPSDEVAPRCANILRPPTTKTSSKFTSRLSSCDLGYLSSNRNPPFSATSVANSSLCFVASAGLADSQALV